MLIPFIASNFQAITYFFSLHIYSLQSFHFVFISWSSSYFGHLIICPNYCLFLSRMILSSCSLFIFVAFTRFSCLACLKEPMCTIKSINTIYYNDFEGPRFTAIKQDNMTRHDIFQILLSCQFYSAFHFVGICPALP